MEKTARLHRAAISLAQDRLVDLGWVNRLKLWHASGFCRDGGVLPYVTAADVSPWRAEEVSDMIRFGEHVKIVEEIEALEASPPTVDMSISGAQNSTANAANFTFNAFHPQQQRPLLNFSAHNIHELEELAVDGFPEAAVRSAIHQVAGPDSFALPATEDELFSTNMVATKNTPEQVDDAAA